MLTAAQPVRHLALARAGRPRSRRAASSRVEASEETPGEALFPASAAGPGAMIDSGRNGVGTQRRRDARLPRRPPSLSRRLRQAGWPASANSFAGSTGAAVDVEDDGIEAADRRRASSVASRAFRRTIGRGERADRHRGSWPDDFAWLDGLRRAHYPAGTQPGAGASDHVPCACRPRRSAKRGTELARARQRPSAPRATVAGLMDLGGGVAFRIVSDELDAIRDEHCGPFPRHAGARRTRQAGARTSPFRTRSPPKQRERCSSSWSAASGRGRWGSPACRFTAISTARGNAGQACRFRSG